MTEERLFSDLTYKILGAAMVVHLNLGSGLSEGIYRKALKSELQDRKIPFESQKTVSIPYKGRQLRLRHFDFLIDRKVMVKIESFNQIDALHHWKVLDCVLGSGFTMYEECLFINFGKPVLEYLPFKHEMGTCEEKNSQQIERIKQRFIAEHQLNHINQLCNKFRKASNDIH